MDIRNFIREHPDHNRCDLSLLYADRAAVAYVVDTLAEPFRAHQPGLVGCIDALGFFLGGALAIRLGVGAVLIRKEGKSAWPCASERFKDYSGVDKTLELAEGVAGPGDRVLLVDDWIETGAQALAAVTLLEGIGAKVVGVARCISTAPPHDGSRTTGCIRSSNGSQLFRVHPVDDLTRDDGAGADGRLTP